MPDVSAAPSARHLLRFSVPALALPVLVFAPAARARPRSEVGDAGDLLSSAQATGGPLTAWSGAPTISPLNPCLLTLTFMQYCDAATAATPSTWGALRIRYGS